MKRNFLHENMEKCGLKDISIGLVHYEEQMEVNLEGKTPKKGQQERMLFDKNAPEPYRSEGIPVLVWTERQEFGTSKLSCVLKNVCQFIKRVESARHVLSLEAENPEGKTLGVVKSAYGAYPGYFLYEGGNLVDLAKWLVVTTVGQVQEVPPDINWEQLVEPMRQYVQDNVDPKGDTQKHLNAFEQASKCFYLKGETVLRQEWCTDITLSYINNFWRVATKEVFERPLEGFSYQC